MWEEKEQNVPDDPRGLIFNMLRSREEGGFVHHERHLRQSFRQKCGDYTHFVERLTQTVLCLGHGGCVNTVNYDKTGRYLVSGSDDKIVKLWDTAKRELVTDVWTYKCVGNYEGHSSNIFETKFLQSSASGDPRLIVSGGNDGDCRVFDVETQKCVSYFPHFTKKVLSIAVSEFHEQSFLVAGGDGTIRYYDLREKHLPGVRRMSRIAPQGFGGGPSRCQKTEQGIIVDYNSSDVMVNSVDINPINGNYFVCCASDLFLRMFDFRKLTKSPDSCIKTLLGDERVTATNETTGCVFSPDGADILSTTLNDGMYLWSADIPPGDFYPQAVPSFGKKSSPSSQPSSSSSSQPSSSPSPRPNPQQLSQPRSLELDVTSIFGNDSWGEQEDVDGLMDDDDFEEEEDVFENIDMERLYTVSQFHLVNKHKDCKADDWKHKQLYRGHLHARTMKGASFYGNNFVASGSDDGNVYMYNRKTGMCVRVLVGDGNIVNNVVKHPHDPVVVASGLDNYMAVWEPVMDEMLTDES